MTETVASGASPLLSVRQLTKLGGWTGGPRTYAVPAGPAGLKTAILLQAGPGGPILAAAKG